MKRFYIFLSLLLSISNFAGAVQTLNNQDNSGIVTVEGNVNIFVDDDSHQWSKVQGQIIAASQNVDLDKINSLFKTGVLITNWSTKGPKASNCEHAIIVLRIFNVRESLQTLPSSLAFNCLK